MNHRGKVFMIMFL